MAEEGRQSLAGFPLLLPGLPAGVGTQRGWGNGVTVPVSQAGGKGG